MLKQLAMLTAMVGFVGAAHAAGDSVVSAPTSCNTYCTGDTVVISGADSAHAWDGSYLTASISLLYGRRCAGKYTCRTVLYDDNGSIAFP